MLKFQVTLEEQMICGALQTLNEEACEDVLEETEECDPSADNIPKTVVIQASPESSQGDSSGPNSLNRWLSEALPGKSCMSASKGAVVIEMQPQKTAKKVAYVDDTSRTVAYVEPTVTILEPNLAEVQSSISLRNSTHGIINVEPRD